MEETKKMTHEEMEAMEPKWKNEFGYVAKIIVEDAVCYLKEPTRKVLSYAMAGGQNNPVQFCEMMLKECWIAGDEIIKTDNAYFLGASAQLSALVKIKESKLVEL